MITISTVKNIFKITIACVFIITFILFAYNYIYNNFYYPDEINEIMLKIEKEDIKNYINELCIDDKESKIDYLKNHFKKLKYTSKNTFSSDNEIKNIVFENNGQSDDTIIFMAHYDSILSTCANDNSSGVTAILIASKVLNSYNLDKNIRFVLTDKEEECCKGSQEYSSILINENTKVDFICNLDMIGGWQKTEHLMINSSVNSTNFYLDKSIKFGKDFLKVADKYNYKSIINPIFKFNKNIKFNNLDILIFNKATVANDASQFHNNFNVIDFIENDYGNNPYYHSEKDTFDNLNIEFLDANIKVLTGTIAKYAKAKK